MPKIEHALRVRSHLGEVVSGDAAIVLEITGGLLLAIVDVLGHGEDAHQLALSIEQFLQEKASPDVAALMTLLHERLKGSRGAAVGLAFLDLESGQMLYTGTGNTICRRFGGSEMRLISRDGVVGQNMPSPLVQCLQLQPGDVLLMYSDGIRTHFSVEEYPRLLLDPAHHLVRTVVDRFGRDHDDCACIALRYLP